MSDAKLIIVAGPDGAGKTTFIETRLAGVFEVINPHNVFHQYQKQNPGKDAMESWRNVDNNIQNRINENITKGTSFSISTDFASQATLNQIKAVKAKGFEIEVHYISLENLRKHYERIAFQKNDKGAPVYRLDMERRFLASYEKLPEILSIADKGYIYNNSNERGPQKVLETQNGVIKYVIQDYTKIPEPARNGLHDTDLKIGEKISDRSNERSHEVDLKQRCFTNETYRYEIVAKEDNGIKEYKTYVDLPKNLAHKELMEKLTEISQKFADEHPTLQKSSAQIVFSWNKMKTEEIAEGIVMAGPAKEGHSLS